jgi:formate dehydrogenase subunit gamma
MGSEAVHDAVHRRLGVGWHETTADGAVTVEPVFCLGLCAVAPSGMLDGAPLGRLDAAGLAATLDLAR